MSPSSVVFVLALLRLSVVDCPCSSLASPSSVYHPSSSILGHLLSPACALIHSICRRRLSPFHDVVRCLLPVVCRLLILHRWSIVFGRQQAVGLRSGVAILHPLVCCRCRLSSDVIRRGRSRSSVPSRPPEARAAAYRGLRHEQRRRLLRLRVALDVGDRAEAALRVVHRGGGLARPPLGVPRGPAPEKLGLAAFVNLLGL